jgi:hypothetical protein
MERVLLSVIVRMIKSSGLLFVGHAACERREMPTKYS